MNNKNFAGQKLDGRSFRGQDLRGADFSGCSLKSCDFRRANLSQVNFRAANFGVSRRRIIWKMLFGSLIGSMLGFLSIVINLMQLMVSGYFGLYIVDRDWYVIGFAVFYGLGWFFPIFCSLLLKQINSLFVYMASGAAVSSLN